MSIFIFTIIMSLWIIFQLTTFNKNMTAFEVVIHFIIGAIGYAFIAPLFIQLL